MMPVDKIAIITVTRNATKLGTVLHSELPESDLYVPAQFASLAPGAKPYENARDTIANAFREYRSLVVFLALGATVRLIAPLVQDKSIDPAVVVVDDQANFAISALCGHVGGANVLAEKVARILGAQPVITTGSDVIQTIAVDLLGREFGWQIAYKSTITEVSAAVVNGEEIGFLQETGEPRWWSRKNNLPENIEILGSIEEARRFPGHLMIVTDRVFGEEDAALLSRAVVYRPKSLVVGIGCNRNTTANEIERVVEETLASAGMAKECIRTLATVNKKQDESGLIEYAEKHGVPILFFPPEDLAEVADMPNPSETVQKHIGAAGVSEPAAYLASFGGDLIIPKRKCGNVTVAIAMFNFQDRRAGWQNRVSS